MRVAFVYLSEVDRSLICGYDSNTQKLTGFEYLSDEIILNLLEFRETIRAKMRPYDAGIVVFNFLDFVSVPIEIPRGLSFDQREKLIRNYLADEPLFENTNQFITSIPDAESDGEVGVGVLNVDKYQSIRSCCEEIFLLSILPVEALLGLYLMNGCFVLSFDSCSKFLKVDGGMLKESFIFNFDDINVIEKDLNHNLSVSRISLDFRNDFLWELMNLATLTLSSKAKRHNLDFARFENKQVFATTFFRVAKEQIKFVSLIASVILLVILLFFLLNLSSFLVTRHYARVIAGATSVEEMRDAIEGLQTDLSKLEKDIEQLSVLNFPNFFSALVELSKHLNAPLDSLEFNPPRLLITGVANEYAPIENLKRELLKDRDVFCGVKLESLKDFRNQKRFTFQLNLCKG
ncbi:MAG: hypothetical protein NZO16_00135 [Deltaproteobacteria bacterium]|nr:hypothetical protein [Deltaproteobacteria bacterium]